MYEYFHPIFYNILLIVIIISTLLTSATNNINRIRGGTSSNILVLIIILILSIIFGYRPGTTNFGDTALYQRNYEKQVFIYDSEPVFNWIGKSCSDFNFPTGVYLSIIAFLYILGPYYLLQNKTDRKWFSLLFILSSFSFLGYAVNGIRNGLALSILTICFVFINNKGKIRWLSLIITAFIAVGIHKSAILPACCLIFSILFIKDVKIAIIIWLIAIPISVVGGSRLSYMFLGLGFDNRLDEYLLGVFKTGFRWDFILYSVIPIILAYYTIYIKKIQVDTFYIVLINTYILANAFWIIIIEAAFSNRFAYLSWFLYPIVFAYPLLKYKLWHNQNSKVSLCLFLYYIFTYLMYIRS